ncbi:MAG: peptidase MA family metallohydrolase [Dehalococcoidales bacterium]|nr:peptidase MA family metallohydrolase [Dehalococcoidales bacterium]
MLKKIVSLFFAVCLVLFMALPAHAAGSITVKSSSVESGFPNSVTFNISAISSAQITDIRLHYTTEQLGFAHVESEAFVVFTPSTSVNASWKWDMRKSGGLPPGAVITYWWTITDSTGNKLNTSEAQFKFDDTRFKWLSLTQDKTTLYWYNGSQSFAQDIMSTTQNALVRLANDTGATLQDPIRIYLYANNSDLLGSMIFPQDWTGGVSFTESGCIVIGISSSNITWGRTAIAHELTHLVTHQMTFNPYSGIPTWLEEGLAMYNQGSVDATFTSALQNAIANNTLLTLKTLSSPFSAYANISYLSYAESWNAVDYLIKTYGKDKMTQLLATFQQGSTYDNALLTVYGKDTKALNTEWQATLKKPAGNTLSSVPMGAFALATP